MVRYKGDEAALMRRGFTVDSPADLWADMRSAWESWRKAFDAGDFALALTWAKLAEAFRREAMGAMS